MFEHHNVPIFADIKRENVMSKTNWEKLISFFRSLVLFRRGHGSSWMFISDTAHPFCQLPSFPRGLPCQGPNVLLMHAIKPSHSRYSVDCHRYNVDWSSFPIISPQGKHTPHHGDLGLVYCLCVSAPLYGKLSLLSVSGGPSSSFPVANTASFFLTSLLKTTVYIK